MTPLFHGHLHCSLPLALCFDWPTLPNSVQKLASRACEDAVRIWKLYSGSWRMKCFLDLQLHSKEASNGVSDVAWTRNLGPPEKVLLKMYCSHEDHGQGI
uniref:Uncharacterized protein n=1 Tax=Nymphaea colorata TaxID=210225 RepID=A0A5K1A883_9MAGN